MKLIYQGNEYSAIDALQNLQSGQAPWLNEVIWTIQQWNQQSDVTIHTSGSTGTPKKIELSYDSLIQSALKTIAYFELVPGQLIWCCLPAQYIAGKMMLIRGLVGEMDMLITRPAANPMADLEQKVDFAAMTPMQLAIGLKNYPEKMDLIDTIILGGGPVDDSLLSQLQTIDSSVYHTYGMTETVTHVAVRRLNGANKTTSFRALPGVTFSLSSQESLIIHAEHLEIKDMMTTDAVALISPTEFIWKGRIDHVINSGGVKLHPEILESKITPIIGARFFLSSLPDPFIGQKLILIIEDIDANIEEIQSRLKDTLSKVELPKQIFRVKKLVETPTGKINRDLALYDL